MNVRNGDESGPTGDFITCVRFGPWFYESNSRYRITLGLTGGVGPGMGPTM